MRFLATRYASELGLGDIVKTFLLAFFLFSFSKPLSADLAQPLASPSPSPSVKALGVEESALDRSVSPCDDFYQFACGGWLKTAEIPNDLPAWSRGIYSLREQARSELHSILEKYSASHLPDDDPDRERLGNYYSACMDETAAEKNSLKSLKAEFKQIDAVKTEAQLTQKVADLHLKGVNVLFDFGPEQSCKDASFVVGNMDQAGLSLPDPEYYLKDEGKNPFIREEFQKHLVKMFTLIGTPQAKAKANAKVVFDLETNLAKRFLPRVERRDPKKLCNLLDRPGLLTRVPQFHWALYFAAMGTPNVQKMNIAVPDYFNGLSQILSTTSLDDLKTYMKWHVLSRVSASLTKKIVAENFEFSSKTFTGQKEIEPRWKRCVSATEGALGEPLGRAYTHAKFDEQSKTKARSVITEIEKSFEEELNSVKWMDDSTRTKALTKLHALVNQVGYPDKWRDFGKLQTSRTDYFGNLLASSKFDSEYELNKIEKPADRTEWEMFPQTVNAYYSSDNNKMVFPAGILQYPFFDENNPTSVNYGGIGMVMGHELTHGFDDEGRQYDEKGNLNPWWTEKTETAFNERTACLTKQYDDYSPLENLHVRGKLTLGENIADNGGIRLAYSAFKKASRQVGSQPVSFTQDQQFFLGFAQAWCSKIRPEVERSHLITDPHSPPKFRVNGPVSNFPAFAEAFRCKADSPMVRKPACVVW